MADTAAAAAIPDDIGHIVAAIAGALGVVFVLAQMQQVHRALTWLACLAYAGLLVYLNVLGLGKSRQFFFDIAPELAVMQGDQQYAENCDGDVASIMGTLDIFVLAHSAGYWGKMMIMRSYPMVWIISLGFEHVEVLFQHLLPNFLECWWDHVLLDVLLCNLGGMILGAITLRVMGMEMFDWFKGTATDVKRAALLLLPAGMCLLCETCLFFLKFFLMHPPSHWIVLARMLFWFNLSMRCYPLFYRYLEENTTSGAVYQATKIDPASRVGFPRLVVMSVVVLVLECALCWRYYTESDLVALPAMPLFLRATFAAACALCGLAAALNYGLGLRSAAVLLVAAAAVIVTAAHFAGIPKLEYRKAEVEALVSLALRELGIQM